MRPSEYHRKTKLHIPQNLINSMQLSPFWEDDSCLSHLEIPCLIWNPYSQEPANGLWVSISSQYSWFRSLTPYSFSVCVCVYIYIYTHTHIYGWLHHPEASPPYSFPCRLHAVFFLPIIFPFLFLHAMYTVFLSLYAAISSILSTLILSFRYLFLSVYVHLAKGLKVRFCSFILLPLVTPSLIIVFYQQFNQYEFTYVSLNIILPNITL
jgi:hypothetical protein